MYIQNLAVIEDIFDTPYGDMVFGILNIARQAVKDAEIDPLVNSGGISKRKSAYAHIKQILKIMDVRAYSSQAVYLAIELAVAEMKYVNKKGKKQ